MMRSFIGAFALSLLASTALAQTAPVPAYWQMPLTSGDLAMFKNSGAGTTIQDAGSSSAALGQLTINYPSTYASGVPDPTTNWLWLNDSSLVGTCTSAVSAPNACTLSQVQLTNDQLNSTTGRAIFLESMIHSFGGGASNGSYGGLYVQLTAIGARNFAANDVAMLPKVFANANSGGALGTEKGAMFAINPDASVGPNGTNWTAIIGEEIDIAINTGGSALDKIGEQIITTTQDNVQAGRFSVGLTIASQQNTGGPGLMYGIALGNYSGYNAIAATGTLIGEYCHSNNCPGFTPTVAHGIDFSNVTFTSDAFKSKNFLIDGTGNATVLSLTGTAGLAITAGANGIVTLGDATNGTAVRITDPGGPSVNLFNITPGQTGQSVILSCGGPTADANVNCSLNTKGTGIFLFSTGGGKQLQINTVASAVDFINLIGSAAGSPGVVTFGVGGTDTNVDISLAPKGSGVIRIGATQGVTCAGAPTASFASTGGLVTHC